MKISIVGCGYAGRILAQRLVSRGNAVRATTTTTSHLASLAALGAEPSLLRSDEAESLKRGLDGAEVIIYLAPPAEKEEAEALASRLFAACPDALKTFVYGSTTAAFGRHPDSIWIDETTPPQEVHEAGRERLAIERALADKGLPLKVVRIAGIYGPGRTLRDAIQRQALVLVEGAPPTSRIHVEDLARLLEAMGKPSAPPLAIACDEEPAPTIDVARYTCELLKLEAPAPMALEEAKRVLSVAAQQMRLEGRRCRSLVRESLIGPLLYPNYRVGVRASLEAEGTSLSVGSTW